MKVFAFICSIIIVFTLVSCNEEDSFLIAPGSSVNIIEPDSIINLAGYNYGLYENVWYTINNDSRGDLVDTNHIILRLINDGDVNDYDFEKIGLPKLTVAGTDIYFLVEIPGDLNPFYTGKLLWNSGDFKELIFNVFIPVHTNYSDLLISRF